MVEAEGVAEPRRPGTPLSPAAPAAPTAAAARTGGLHQRGGGGGATGSVPRASKRGDSGCDPTTWTQTKIINNFENNNNNNNNNNRAKLGNSDVKSRCEETFLFSRLDNHR